MKELYMPVGMSSFRKLRTEGCWYCDKTGFIADFLKRPGKATLFTRPRRFGKTLFMDTLAEFLDIEKDGRDIFAGLEIMKNEAVCTKWMNKVPVIFLSLKDVDCLTFEESIIEIGNTLSQWCSCHDFLADSPKVDQVDRENFSTLLEADFEAVPEDDVSRMCGQYERLLSNSLSILIRILSAHYGVAPVILIDEYDVPVAKAEHNGFYDPMVRFMWDFLGKALKDNKDCRLAVLTGCLRIAPGSYSTGLNVISSFSVFYNRHSEMFGFTAPEVHALLEEAGLSDREASIREYYDGYLFGVGTKIFCPWDIIRRVKALQHNRMAPPINYWKNTSDNEVVSILLEKAEAVYAQEDIEQLLKGGCITTNISELLCYGEFYTSIESLWSLLFHTGYLTKASEELRHACGCTEEDGRTCLVIPNKEVRDIFVECIKNWFMGVVLGRYQPELFQTMWGGSADALSAVLTNILDASISTRDTSHEDYYQELMLRVFSARELPALPLSNGESGTDMPGIIVKKGGKACILKIKLAKGYNDLEESAQEALAQIQARGYASNHYMGMKVEHCYGIACFEKTCLVLKAPEA